MLQADSLDGSVMMNCMYAAVPQFASETRSILFRWHIGVYRSCECDFLAEWYTFKSRQTGFQVSKQLYGGGWIGFSGNLEEHELV
jgi:hypothetical protein